MGKEEKSYLGWNVIAELERVATEDNVAYILNEIDLFLKKWSVEIEGYSDINLKPSCYIYLSYDLGEKIIKVNNHKNKEDSFFDVAIYICRDNLIFDHNTNEYIYLNIDDQGLNEKELISRFENEIGNTQNSFEKISANFKEKSELESIFSYSEYIQILELIKDYIYEGHIYQVNMSQKFSWRINEQPFKIYEKIRSSNPAPYSAYFKKNQLSILSTSPERFLTKRGTTIITEPIKGTRPRGRNEVEEKENYNQLLSSEKECSENTMIVDLLRNDLGRIAKAGTVSVERLMFIEKYASVLQLVSKVTAEIDKDATFGNILLKTFPGGSITGCPKKRAMEVIQESEPQKRSLYTGSLGRVSLDNSEFDLNILIRTIFVDENNASLSLGGGIVYDSVVSKEYQETLDKGEAIFNGLKRN